MEEEPRNVLLPVERALVAEPRYTLAELIERSGMEEDVARRRIRSLGITVPDAEAVAFSEEDVAAVARHREYEAQGIDPDEGQAVTHMLSGQMARAADPLRRLFARTYGGDVSGDEEDAVAQELGERAQTLLPLLFADIEYLLRRHLADFARNEAFGVGEMPDSYEVAVAFVDIVGFTALGEELPEGELSEIAGRLEMLVDAHVAKPVRVIKTIGDAVMLVSEDADALVAAMVDIVAAAEDLPDLRVGIAYGRAVPRLGDWYGPAVNLAARLTGRARPDSILVTNALSDALKEPDRYTLSDAGHKRFKGISEPVAVRRLRSSG